ncbi:FXSXX-COOH protein [Streptomyces albipurpureus]|uniref:FXSXX-COOH protein n=1 Tax=Streptomyces albipurpureus TaxID=2897419 RepID=A0ABT0UPA7_9ACTN|nr:FXSXX-COOH protein [Streptomyces sp. CWNU-1]MCM2390270.1 FXSXX-COOH protein [Streptomyces sp. CWNU-1]
MAIQTPASFAVAKRNRVPLAQIDVRGGEVAKKLARIIPATADRTVRTSSFNSAL